MKKVLSITILALVFLPVVISAKIGVGVGTGKIVIDEKLKQGGIYELPPLTVLNTGDEPSEYEVEITYHEGQKEITPPNEWFDFSPQNFYLEPGEAQTVAIILNIPVKTTPGDYFGYLEGHPLKKQTVGVTSVGVAAAAKLYFTVSPSSWIQGVYHRALSLWDINQPWTTYIAIVLGIVILYLILSRFININIGFKKKEKKEKNE